MYVMFWFCAHKWLTICIHGTLIESGSREEKEKENAEESKSKRSSSLCIHHLKEEKKLIEYIYGSSLWENINWSIII